MICSFNDMPKRHHNALGGSSLKNRIPKEAPSQLGSGGEGPGGGATFLTAFKDYLYINSTRVPNTIKPLRLVDSDCQDSKTLRISGIPNSLLGLLQLARSMTGCKLA